MRPSKALTAFILLVAAILVGAVALTAVDAQTERDRMQEWNTAIAVPLSGSQQVPPVDDDDDGSGIAAFWPNGDLEEICYIVHVADLEDDVTQASIHWIQEDGAETGEAVVILTPAAQDDDEDDEGVVALGTISAQNLTGPMSGASMAQFIDALEAGNLYVNVITEDYPDGEIRGDINANATCPDILALGQEMLDDDDRESGSGGAPAQSGDDDDDNDD